MSAYQLSDSNFNLPPEVIIKYDADSHKNRNLKPFSPSNNPQVGSLAAEAFSDANLSTTFDPHAISGYRSNLILS